MQLPVLQQGSVRSSPAAAAGALVGPPVDLLQRCEGSFHSGFLLGELRLLAADVSWHAAALEGALVLDDERPPRWSPLRACCWWTAWKS